MKQPINKQQLLEQILQILTKAHQVAVAAAHSAIDAATNEQTVPEHKYDTLALEASYLAHGQAMRVQECEKEIAQFKQLPIHLASETVKIGSLVRLIDDSDNLSWVFFAPCSGGLKFEYQQQMVTVVTLKSPLGAALFNKSIGDEAIYIVGEKSFCYEIDAID